MQFGLASGSLEQIRQSRRWGYDYVEIHAALLRPLEPDRVWPARRRELEESGQTLAALCNFVPAEARFVGPEADFGRLRGFLESCVGRAAEVGVRVFNWGSPFSKSVPADWPYSRAFEQIERAGQIMADVMRQHGGLCVIEPINPRECNVIYYVTDAAHVARTIGRPEVMALADFFHMSLQGEPLGHIAASREWLAHTHTSGPERRFPAPGQPWDQAAFLGALRAAGYDRRLTVESWQVADGSTFADDARASVAYLRRLWEEGDRCASG